MASVDFTRTERQLIDRLRTPLQVQRYLWSLPYNWELGGATLRGFRGVVAHGSAHCLEAVLFAATVLEHHGYPPLVLDLEAQDDVDHVVFLFRDGDRWGTVGRSRCYGLHGRKPVYRTVRSLALSYQDPFIDRTGRLTGFGTANLTDLVSGRWRMSERNVWEVERALIAMPHERLKTSDARYRRLHAKYLNLVDSGPLPSRAEWRAFYGPGRATWC